MKKKSVHILGLLMVSHGFTHLILNSLGALLPLVRLEFTLTYTQIGILMFTLSMLTSVGSLAMGFISDRMNRLWLISQMFFIVAILSPFFLLARNGVLLFSFLGIICLCIAVFHPAAQAHLSHSYLHKRGEIFGFYEVGGSLGMVIAPSFALGIASIWGWKSVYATYALPALLLAFGVGRTTEGGVYLYNNKNSKPAVRFLDGLKTILSSRRLRLVYVIQGAIACIFSIILSYFTIFMVDMHGFKILHAGYLLTFLLCGGVLGKFVGGKTSDIWGRNRVMGVSFALLIPLYFLFSFVGGLPALIILSFFLGLVSHMIFPVIIASIGDYAMEGIGLTYGLQSLVGFGFGAISSLVVGVLADLFDIIIIFRFLTGASLLGLTCVFLLALENRRNSVQRSEPGS